MAKFLVTGGAGFIGGNFLHIMVDKYPNDEYVLYNLMYDLWVVEREKNSEEIIGIATKLLKSDSSEIRYGAIQILAFTYSKLGNDEKAVEYAKMGPCNRDLLSSVLKGKELVEHCRLYFWNVCVMKICYSIQ